MTDITPHEAHPAGKKRMMTMARPSTRQAGWPLAPLMAAQFYVFRVFADGAATDPGWFPLLAGAVAAFMLFLVVRNALRLLAIPAAEASLWQLVAMLAALLLTSLWVVGPVSAGVAGWWELLSGALTAFVGFLVVREALRLLRSRPH